MAGPMSSRGTKVYLGGSLEELAITSVSKAAPAVVTLAAAPAAGEVEVGDFVSVKGTGFKSLDGKVFQVDTVALADVTLKASDTSAEAGTVTGGLMTSSAEDMVEICFASVTRDSPAAATLDVTTLCDAERQQLTGMPNNGTWTAQGFYDPASAGQIALHEAYDMGDTRIVAIVPPDNSVIAFNTQINQLSESFAVDQPIQITTGGVVLGKVTYAPPGTWEPPV